MHLTLRAKREQACVLRNLGVLKNCDGYLVLNLNTVRNPFSTAFEDIFEINESLTLTATESSCSRSSTLQLNLHLPSKSEGFRLDIRNQRTSARRKEVDASV
ncbi:hypothetical protein CEXT_757031 [Caerostris extrusa]|uniref:Uncharacterized protein n=1 Tax=Caerostris extrusa TaxID=172846 RepID=A0AAV4YA32_CAEEX|nr:hypothetical protein CEXT_757031 [Caerostris extrusa]